MTQKLNSYGIQPSDWTWLFIGLVGPLLPALVAGVVALTRQNVPTYGPLLLLAISAAALIIIVVREQVITEGHRKALKAGLDKAWNLWTFLGVGTLFITFAGGAKLEDLLGQLTVGWVSAVFIAVCTVAAARFSLSFAEILLLRWSSPIHTPAG